MNTNGFSHMEVQHAGFPARALNAFADLGKYKTVGELAEAKDEELMNVPRIGRRTINQIRQRLAELKAKSEGADVKAEPIAAAPMTQRRNASADSGLEIEWAKSHKNLVLAIMSGEVTIQLKG